MDFSSQQDFELHVHKCFGQIFDRLTKIDGIVKAGAEQEEQQRKLGPFNELMDYVEDVILHCHLAWQYHRLSKMTQRSTWDRVENTQKDE